MITERVVGDVVIVDLIGNLNSDERSNNLEDKIKDLKLRNQLRVILNLAEAPYVNSMGLAMIVRAYTLIARAGGSLKLLCPSERVTNLLTITKLLTVFEIFNEEKEAVDSFKRVRI